MEYLKSGVTSLSEKDSGVKLLQPVNAWILAGPHAPGPSVLLVLGVPGKTLCELIEQLALYFMINLAVIMPDTVTLKMKIPNNCMIIIYGIGAVVFKFCIIIVCKCLLFNINNIIAI